MPLHRSSRAGRPGMNEGTGSYSRPGGTCNRMASVSINAGNDAIAYRKLEESKFASAQTFSPQTESLVFLTRFIIIFFIFSRSDDHERSLFWRPLSGQVEQASERGAVRRREECTLIIGVQSIKKSLSPSLQMPTKLYGQWRGRFSKPKCCPESNMTKAVVVCLRNPCVLFVAMA